MFIKGKKNDITSMIQDTLEGYIKTQDSMHEIDQIANQSRMLANNAAREFGRMDMGGFQIVTQEIKRFAETNRKTNQRNKENVEALNAEINNLVGLRTADVAYDLIDKIDRNLFERNCDVQAWATFETFKDYFKNPSEEGKKKINATLKNLHRIYEVYYDMYLADRNGIIVGAAVHEEGNGRDISKESWFVDARDSDGVVVTDMHMSKFLQKYVVSYSCKVVDEDGTFMGVLSIRFNWNYILDLIDESKISNNGEVYLINKEGQVIAARERELIFHKNMLLECQGAQTILSEDKNESYGYALEVNEQDQLTRVLGYAKTKGYNQYKGQEWAVLALENIR